ncbi:hypothetical protein L218DRAFT_808190, partial [Marasmius fiardii PR-910]
HVRNIQDDPQAIFDTLKSIHIQQKTRNRWNALNDLLSIQKLPDETLPSLSSHVNTALTCLQQLTPTTIARPTAMVTGSSETPYTLQDLYNNLEAMALVCSLPEDYDNFISLLLILDHLTVKEIKSAFHNEESQCC